MNRKLPEGCTHQVPWPTLLGLAKKFQIWTGLRIICNGLLVQSWWQRCQGNGDRSREHHSLSTYMRWLTHHNEGNDGPLWPHGHHSRLHSQPRWLQNQFQDVLPIGRKFETAGLRVNFSDLRIIIYSFMVTKGFKRNLSGHLGITYGFVVKTSSTSWPVPGIWAWRIRLPPLLKQQSMSSGYTNMNKSSNQSETEGTDNRPRQINSTCTMVQPLKTLAALAYLVRIDCPNPEETLEQIVDINCSCGCTINGIHIKPHFRER